MMGTIHNIRNWALRRLAGKSTVAINAAFNPFDGLGASGPGAYVCNCTVSDCLVGLTIHPNAQDGEVTIQKIEEYQQYLSERIKQIRAREASVG